MQQWYYLRGMDRLGPVSSHQLVQLAADGRIDRSTIVLRAGTEKWVPAGSIRRLFAEPRQASCTHSPVDQVSYVGYKSWLWLLVTVLGGSCLAGASTVILPKSSSQSLATARNAVAEERPTRIVAAADKPAVTTGPAKPAPVSKAVTPRVPLARQEKANPTQNAATRAAEKQAPPPKKSAVAKAADTPPAQGEVDVQLTQLGPLESKNGLQDRNVFFSQDGQHVAVVAPEGTRQKVILDGQAGTVYASIITLLRAHEGPDRPGLIFSPDSQRLAYVAQKSAGQQVAVINGKEGPTYRFVIGLTFSPDSKRWGYVGIKNEQECHVIIDGKSSPAFRGVISMSFSADSTRYACQVWDNKGHHVYSDDKVSPPAAFPNDGGVIFSPVGSRLACTVAPKIGGPYQVYVDGKTHQTQLKYVSIQRVQFSTNGETVAYEAQINPDFSSATSRRTDTLAVVNGKEGPLCNKIKLLTLSPDGKRHAYVTYTDSDRVWRMIVDGQDQSSYEDCASVTFSPDSQRLAWTVRSNGAYFMVLDGQDSQPYTAAGPAVFSADSQHVAYVAQKDNQEFVVLDGQPGKQYQYIERASLQFRADGKLLYKAKVYGDLFTVLDEEELGEQFVFSPDLKRKVQLANGTAAIDGVASRQYRAVRDAAFSPDSQRIAFVGNYGESRTEPLTHAVIDGIEEPPHTDILGLCFSADSRHACYVTTDGAYGARKLKLYVDRWAGPEFDAIWWTDHRRNKPGVLRFSEDGSMEFLAVRDQMLYRVRVDLKGVVPLQKQDRTSLPAAGYAVLRELNLPIYSYHAQPVAALTTDAAIVLGFDKGGKYEHGGLVKLPLDGGEPIIVHEFEGGNGDGSMPTSLVVSNRGTLFGTLGEGGPDSGGGLFSLDAKCTQYKFMGPWRGVDFHGNPRGPWLFTAGKDNAVYGYGSFFPSRGIAVTADGTVKLEDEKVYDLRIQTSNKFSNEPKVDQGFGPFVSDQKFLYVAGSHELFRMNHDFTGRTSLHKFDGPPRDADTPMGAPILGPHGLLYGLASPGDHKKGVLYSLKPDGSDYRILRHLEHGLGPLVSGPQNSLYAVQNQQVDGFGNTSGPASLVKIAADGSKFEVLYKFERRNQGLQPEKHIFIHDNVLYGWTRKGGREEKGVFYRYTLTED